MPPKIMLSVVVAVPKNKRIHSGIHQSNPSQNAISAFLSANGDVSVMILDIIYMYVQL